ncbi:hypothetical protein N7467_011142 [Penicillium canescens]|nr:hypothetical protein N7467_011142 [Penicillium canescens]
MLPSHPPAAVLDIEFPVIIYVEPTSTTLELSPVSGVPNPDALKQENAIVPIISKVFQDEPVAWTGDMEVCRHMLKHISAGGEDRPELKGLFCSD